MTTRIALPFLLALSAASPLSAQAQPQNPAEIEATLYSTLPSLSAHRPEMALDGDDSTSFQSVYGMSDGDDFTVLFSRPIPLRALRVVTGTPDGDNLLTQGYVEISTDGKKYRRAASFDAKGVASGMPFERQTTVGAGGIVNGPITSPMAAALRIKINARSGLPKLILREITLDSPAKIAHVGWGAGRAFSDYSLAPDLKTWADTADRQMEQSWADTAARLYSDGFITPNKVNVFYRSGPNVTGVAATGGGEMEVNVAWCRAHPGDTGLTAHEVAHVIQAMSAYNPVWLIEGVADYVRWVKFEPQNFRVQINPAKATYHDAYRTTGAFLAWCELHYDSRLVSKLNNDVRFGNFKLESFKTYTGRDVDTLWSEFLAAYKADPVGIIKPVVAPEDQPRNLPIVLAGNSVAVDLSRTFNAIGITLDGAKFGMEDGFDAGGAAFSGALVGKTLTAQNVQFSLGAAGANNIVSAQKTLVVLPKGQFSSLWLLGGAVEGSQRAQTFTVTYTDGTTQTLVQNLSDWFAPQSFAGENRALRMGYRNRMDGTKDPRPFSLYSYGFALDAAKTVRALTLPDNANVKIAGVSLAR